MVPDGRNGRTDGRTHGRRQNYIPPTSSGDKKKKNSLIHILSAQKNSLIEKVNLSIHNIYFG